MRPPHRRYVIVEAAVGAAFTGALGLLFASTLFHGRGPVALREWDGVVADAIPQTMAGAFICAVVPTLLTRSRLRRGAVAPAPGSATATRNAAARALLLAVAATGAGLALHDGLLLGPARWLFVAVLGWKVASGCTMGACVSPSTSAFCQPYSVLRANAAGGRVSADAPEVSASHPMA